MALHRPDHVHDAAVLQPGLIVQIPAELLRQPRHRALGHLARREPVVVNALAAAGRDSAPPPARAPAPPPAAGSAPPGGPATSRDPRTPGSSAPDPSRRSRRARRTPRPALRPGCRSRWRCARAPGGPARGSSAPPAGSRRAAPRAVSRTCRKRSRSCVSSMNAMRPGADLLDLAPRGPAAAGAARRCAPRGSVSLPRSICCSRSNTSFSRDSAPTNCRCSRLASHCTACSAPGVRS